MISRKAQALTAGLAASLSAVVTAGLMTGGASPHPGGRDVSEDSVGRVVVSSARPTQKSAEKLATQSLGQLAGLRRWNLGLMSTETHLEPTGRGEGTSAWGPRTSPLLPGRRVLTGLVPVKNPNICGPGCECPDAGSRAPRLADLTIVGTKSPFYPPFDPGREHYALKRSPEDRLILNAVASEPELLLEVNGTSGQGSIEVDFSSASGGVDFVIEVRRVDGRPKCGTVPALGRYVLHYLPEDFPDVQVTQKDQGVSEGLIYAVPRFQQDGARVSYLAILDNEGVPRFQRRVEGIVLDFKLHPNGLMTYLLRRRINEFGIADSVVVVLDPSFEEIGVLTTVGLTQTDGHDFLFTPEGNSLFISYNSTTRDMTDFGLAADQTVGDSVIQEVTPQGEVVFQWNSWDHIDISDCAVSGYPRFPVDYAHLNSLHLSPEGDVIASFRGCGQVLKIDRPTGEVEWQLGGSRSDFEIVADPYNEFCGQHTANQLPNGNILMFDNGGYCLGDREEVFGQFSRVLEYRLDNTRAEAVFVRDHALGGSYQIYTRSQGSTQPLANGNVLISWGRGPEMSITEIDAESRQVFAMEIRSEGEIAISYRAYRYPEERVPNAPARAPDSRSGDRE